MWPSWNNVLARYTSWSPQTTWFQCTGKTRRILTSTNFATCPKTRFLAPLSSLSAKKRLTQEFWMSWKVLWQMRLTVKRLPNIHKYVCKKFHLLQKVTFAPCLTPQLPWRECLTLHLNWPFRRRGRLHAKFQNLLGSWSYIQASKWCRHLLRVHRPNPYSLSSLYWNGQSLQLSMQPVYSMDSMKRVYLVIFKNQQFCISNSQTLHSNTYICYCGPTQISHSSAWVTV